MPLHKVSHLSIIEPPKKFSIDIRELWQYRELFYFFAWRDVKVKYKQTLLGIAWVVLQPLLTVIIFSIFFGRALNVPSMGLPYPIFVFSGLLLWNFFSGTITNAGNSMVSNAPIIKKIYFPRLIIPVSSLLVAGIDFGISLLAFVAMLFFFEPHFDPVLSIWCWPLAFIFLCIGTLGISSGLAALNVKYRDFRYVIPFGLQILLFLSPVIYPANVIEDRLIKFFLALNPVYGAINLFRAPLLGYHPDPQLTLVSALSALFFFCAGIYYFKKTEAFFADVA